MGETAAADCVAAREDSGFTPRWEAIECFEQGSDMPDIWRKGITLPAVRKLGLQNDKDGIS